MHNSHFFQKCCHFRDLCFDFSENDNTFERNEDCATVFLKWMDFDKEMKNCCGQYCACYFIVHTSGVICWLNSFFVFFLDNCCLGRYSLRLVGLYAPNIKIRSSSLSEINWLEDLKVTIVPTDKTVKQTLFLEHLAT